MRLRESPLGRPSKTVLGVLAAPFGSNSTGLLRGKSPLWIPVPLSPLSMADGPPAECGRWSTGTRLPLSSELLPPSETVWAADYPMLSNQPTVAVGRVRDLGGRQPNWQIAIQSLLRAASSRASGPSTCLGPR